jgi:hypothetical protein
MNPAPRRVQLDASAHCQLACPSCPTADGSTHAAMSSGHLDVDAFRRLLDANPSLAAVELSNYGEPFLNPRFPELLRLAFERHVTVELENGANLNHATPEALEALVECRVRAVRVSLDGATPATYAVYRRRGDFEKVLAHIRRINELKLRHSTAFPLLTWQFIVFGHNQHEIETARRLAVSLGMRFQPKISWDSDFSPITDARLVQIQTGLAPTRQEHYRATGADYQRGICYQLWNAPVLNWDGRLMGCCRNFWGDFGVNAFADGLEACLDSPSLATARRMLLGLAPPEPGIPCTTCDLYLTMERDRRWLREDEVRRHANPAWVISVSADAAGSPATHADIFIARGHTVNPMLLVQPPRAQRLEIGGTPALAFALPEPGDYLIYALPKRLDPTFRTHYPPLAPVTLPITVRSRPLAQDFRLQLAKA